MVLDLRLCQEWKKDWRTGRTHMVLIRRMLLKPETELRLFNVAKNIFCQDDKAWTICLVLAVLRLNGREA